MSTHKLIKIDGVTHDLTFEQFAKLLNTAVQQQVSSTYDTLTAEQRMNFSKDYISKLYMGCLRSCYDDYQLTQKTPVLTSFYKKMQRATFKMLENFHPSALNGFKHEMKEISWFDDKPKKMTFDDLFELAQESMRTMVATSFTMMCPFQRVKHSRDDLYQIYAECLYSCFEDYRRDKYHESFVDLFFNRMANVTLPWIIDFNGMP